jgi:hypothetical protein
MKKYLLWIPAFAGMTMMLHADDLYLKSGYVYRNVTIIDTLDNDIQFNTSKGIKSYPLVGVLRIEKNIYGPKQELVVEKFSEDTTPPELRERILYRYPTIKLLPISFLAFGFSYSEFSSLKGVPASEKHKFIVPGVLFATAGIINLVFVFERVEVQTNGSGAEISYKF